MRDRRVAGVDAPAFVERRARSSLSLASSGRVAGVDAPAFVERTEAVSIRRWVLCVAGVDAPAFVERSRSAVAPTVNKCVCRRG